MLAHHYLTALELDRAAGAETEGLTRRARLRLREAGDRAYSLAAYPAAKRFYKAALELWPSDDPELAEVLFRHARSQHMIEPLDSLDLIVEARDALLAAGERAAAAEAEVLAGEIFWLRGQRDTAFEKLHAAEALAAGAPTSYSTAYVAANISRFATLAGESDEAIRQARKALAMAEEIGNDALRSHALNNIGIARITLGDFGGLDDLEECVRIAVEANSPESVRAYGNLGSVLLDLGQIDRSFATTKEGLKLAPALRLGRLAGLARVRAHLGDVLRRPLGRGDQRSRPICGGFRRDRVLDGDPVQVASGSHPPESRRPRGAEEDAARALERARLAKDPQVLWPALAIGARVFAATDVRHADSLAGEFLSRWESQGLSVTGGSSEWMTDLPPALAALGREEEFLDFVARIARTTPWLTAAKLVAQRDYAEAAAAYSRDRRPAVGGDDAPSGRGPTRRAGEAGRSRRRAAPGAAILARCGCHPIRAGG